MQLLTAKCPYCGNDVETTIDHTAETIVCPQCDKPFEIAIPVANVQSVREVADSDDSHQLAEQREERTIFVVHPVVFRARPILTIIGLTILIASVYGLWIALADGWNDSAALLVTDKISEINWLFWLSVAGLIVVVVAVAYWFVLSAFTTLTITDSRSIYQKGLFSRDTSEVQHDDVRNIQLEQSMFQRLMRTGQISISSSGQDGLEIVASRIPNPETILKTVRENQR